MEIIAIKIKGSDQKVCDFLLPYVSLERREMLRRFRFSEDRLRSLFSELLIRTYAIEKWGIANEDIDFVKNKYGKPALSGFPDCQFNITHSGQWVVAVFDTLPVRIDVEKVSQIDIAIADSFFSSLEKFQLNEQPEENKLSYFYKLWTLKESYIKAIGRGLSIPLHSFSFDLTEDGISLQSTEENETRFFRQYVLDVEYELAVCGLRPNLFPEKIHIRSWEDLVFRFQSLISMYE
ncbi:4'-phosphopantetheinyl transferase family protein [Peribacillus simplex]|uniref:4'-phosphopantetheinyl transferase family protein n=1 Tax=Peribacillus simplex TaxID=1478 RepID=UPI003D284B64